MPVVDETTFQSTNPKVFFGGDAAFGPKNIIWAVAHGHQAAISIHQFCQGVPVTDRPPPMVTLASQKMGIHEWSYDNGVSLDLRFKVPHRDKIAALKEKFGDDRQKLNAAMMEMYRTEKINPLGGCLPIVIQIPVFISLYYVLLSSVELRDAPWIFWVQDLATRDPYFILPAIMMGTMFLQMKLNPTPPDPVQAKVMMFMPLVFGGMMFFFPSGLVLYWCVNNILSIAQQWYITQKMAKLAATPHR